MKKHFGIALLITSLSLLSSCSRDDYGMPYTETQYRYIASFNKAFGVPASDQDWGFDGVAVSSARMTRSVNVNGDIYDAFTFPSEDELNAAFPTTIPATAQEVSGLTGNLYFVYKDNSTGRNYKVTQPGTVTIGGNWNNDNDKAKANNIYIDVNGSVNIVRNGFEYANIYVLRGNVTLDANFGEFGGLVSVADGATLNWQSDHVAHNGGIKLFNRGTINFSNTYHIDLGNNASFYNEGKVNVTTSMTYSAGAGNTSYFINFGGGELNTPSLTFNSTCHFFSGGQVNVTGETSVTQNAITWINDGHFTTGSMTFSAKNSTFYNYCQLVVKNTAKMLDGEFNMMNGSYAEIGQMLMNNFVVNMGHEAGFNVLSGSKFGRQGQGTYQGFRAFDDAAVAFVRLAGATSVPTHNGAAFHVQGVKMTLAYENMTFYNSVYSAPSQYTSFENVSYGDETTEEALRANGDGRTTADYHNVTSVVTGDDFAACTFTTREGECAATWNGPRAGGHQTPDVRIIAEDLSASQNSDFDFNDVVFDVTFTSNTTATITLQAAGGTLPLTIAGQEVHQLFGVAVNEMVNTRASGSRYATGRAPVSFDITGIDRANNGKDIRIMVQKNDVWEELMANKGVAAAKIAVTPTFEWCDEYQSIDVKYPLFKDWVQNKSVIWYE